MDQELKQYLEAMETRINARLEAMENRLSKHIDAHFGKVEEPVEETESKLIAALHKWTRGELRVGDVVAQTLVCDPNGADVGPPSHV